MTALPKSQGLSAHDLARFERDAGVEFVDGKLLEKPVSYESSRVESRIILLLGNEADRTGAASVFPASLAYRCYADDPTRFRRPDVSVIRAERLVGLDPVETGMMPIPADLVVEVLSTHDLAYNVARKVNDYLTNGFGLVWLVHPNVRTVVIHRADGSAKLLPEGDEITGETALPTFRCKVAEFFSRPV